MIHITIVGTGALARNLYHNFIESKKVALQIIGRSKEQLDYFSNATTTTNFKSAQDSELIILAVSDTDVSICEELIGISERFIVHCAGSLALDVLKSPNAGVLYPLQTFNIINIVDLKRVPILIEATNESSLKYINNVAHIISSNVCQLNSQKRKEAHLAAIFANNFSNYLYGISKELLEEFDLPEDLLDELILQTAKNAIANHPKEIQSGPAKRNDVTAIKLHLDMIYNPNHKDLYEKLSNAIKDYYYEL